LTLGDYRRGFEQYEMRWRRSGMPARRRDYGRPLWLGEYPPGHKTLLLHAEQGLGDTIQFVRYAPLLARMGAKIVLEVQPELLTLLGRVEGIADIIERGAPLPAIDLHCPMGSLPLAMRTEAAAIPAAIPYLAASQERIAHWRARLAHLAPPRVAIAWSGRAPHPNGRNRSLAPLLGLDRVSFIAIECELPGQDAETLARIPRGFGRHFGRPLGRRHGRPDMGPAALPPGLALDARAPGQSMVSDRAALSPARFG
jgi:hypothetical protein